MFGNGHTGEKFVNKIHQFINNDKVVEWYTNMFKLKEYNILTINIGGTNV
jgi:hypothetical protein